MRTVSRSWSSLVALAAGTLAGCSGGGSSGGSGPTVALAVTDAASEQLSTFVIGLESVELQRAVGGPVSLLQLPIAVDFAALSDLSRVLNVTAIPADTYTGVEVELLFDGDRVFVNGLTTPAALLDTAGNPLTGTLALSIDFPTPLVASSGNVVLELDLDLNQAVDVDSGLNEVYLEPTILPRLSPANPKERAVGGDLRTVVLGQNLFRIGLEALPGDPTPVVTVRCDAQTVFQIDGTCLQGLAGLSALDNLAAGSWVQAFGSMDTSSSYFDAATVEAGTGSYNGGSDIVEGVVTGLSGADVLLRGHANNSTHTVFEFNLNYTATTDPVDTKVVRRGSNSLYDTGELNVGQKVRMFGLKNGNTLDVSTATDVIRCEPTRVQGTANGAPAGGMLEITLVRVDLRDEAIFNWAQGGATPADPLHFELAVGNLSAGQGIVAGTPVDAVGFFTGVNDAGADFTAVSLVNRDLVPSLLVIRDRAAGMTVTTTTSPFTLDFSFTGVAAGREKAVIDRGFIGETDLVPTGVTLVPSDDGVLGLGIYVLRDRTLNTLNLYFGFAAFTQGVEDALLAGATLLNVGALGKFDDGASEVQTALAGVVVQ